LKFALYNFHVDKKLLDITRIDSNHYHPSEVLIQNRNLHLIPFLMKNYQLKLHGEIMSFSGKRRRKFSAILSAVNLGDSCILRELANIVPKSLFHSLLSFCDEQGRTPLAIAVVNDKPELVKVLLDVKAPVDYRSWGGDTALQIGVQIGVSRAVVSLLLEVGANPKMLDSTGVAPTEKLVNCYNIMIQQNFTG